MYFTIFFFFINKGWYKPELEKLIYDNGGYKNQLKRKMMSFKKMISILKTKLKEHVSKQKWQWKNERK